MALTDGLQVDVRKLGGTTCSCCGKMATEDHPIMLSQKCHPGTGLILAYAGGDKLVASCRMCTAFAFFLVVGETALPTVPVAKPYGIVALLEGELDYRAKHGGDKGLGLDLYADEWIRDRLAELRSLLR